MTPNVSVSIPRELEAVQKELADVDSINVGADGSFRLEDGSLISDRARRYLMTVPDIADAVNKSMLTIAFEQHESAQASHREPAAIKKRLEGELTPLLKALEGATTAADRERLNAEISRVRLRTVLENT